MNIHCLKCKHKTKTNNLKIFKNENKHRVMGTCDECFQKKNQFIGEGLANHIKNIGLLAFQKTANKLRKPNGKTVRKLLKGEIHYGKHAFTGPGTRIDLQKVRNFPAYNNIDECSKQHDIEYQDAFNEPNKKKRQKMIRDADKKAIKCYNKYKNEDGYNVAKTGINSKMNIEKLSPAVSAILFGTYAGYNK